MDAIAILTFIYKDLSSYVMKVKIPSEAADHLQKRGLSTVDVKIDVDISNIKSVTKEATFDDLYKGRG